MTASVAAGVVPIDTNFRAALERKFGLDLSASPTMFTVRGVCGADDGQIHTDSKSKIITVLLYLNEAWAPDGGRLRLLRNGDDLNAIITEVPPDLFGNNPAISA